ncbi:conserved hypothetical protein [Beutenbergia cavernae DSM 12333]|uniref:Uncharacterized protein n=1 Tax=Beutenbergia cavernae (strain ATCC BAA-8 / DSM 12333 / CCUG 43141 / JCM 11478 / NBRC 16432 / NCIMB 13614 / HKI 0122) TaxID=471853 RepID=C5C3C5_BEUC1|nr:maleylpyruvate isomerase N-terminal domain-containing protein [Beutenbergia cavernae]ACQ79824.1 conserved hypothetical protein [Beutenbergia cavernae DSM 12333]
MTPDDVRDASRWLAEAIRSRPDADLSVPAGPVDWSCRQTLDHVLDDLLAYALQLGGAGTAWAQRDYLPLVAADGGFDVMRVDPGVGVDGIADTLVAAGAVMAAAVAVAPPTARARHPRGLADAAGWAAMAVIETVVHGWDVLNGLDGAPPALPENLAAGVLARLFPDVAPPAPGEAGATLVWATGRGELPGQARRTSWNWDANVR